MLRLFGVPATLGSDLELEEMTMPLSKVQRQTLEQYRSYRGKRPGAVYFVRLNLWRYVLLVGVAVVGFMVLLSLGVSAPAYLLLGLLAGALLRDYALFRRFKHSWPVVEGLLDWDRLNDLLEGKVPGEEALQ
jgi:hypothetical protein